MSDRDWETIALLKGIKSGIGWACIWLFIIMLAVCGVFK
jgi:hypothetical protein